MPGEPLPALRGDFAIPARVEFAAAPWVPSPEPAIERKLLERDGGEVARATSIVRYRANSRFPAHAHERGEELMVLDGVFADEHGSYPAGTYVRNPPGSRHQPFSIGGCTIFVKLRQIADGDTRRCVIGPGDRTWRSATSLLHAFGGERVMLVRVDRGELAIPDHPGGAELVVLEGTIDVAGAACPPWTWLRTPAPLGRVRSATGGVLWLKQGHLPAARP